jgi:hypothetical protein
MNHPPRLLSPRLVRWLPLLLAAIVGSVALADSADAPVEGLLLGVRTRYDFDHPEPTTFLVTANGIKKLGEGLAVPHRGGFWWVGNVKEEQLVPGNTPTLKQFARLVATPPSRKPKPELRSQVVRPGAPDERAETGPTAANDSRVASAPSTDGPVPAEPLSANVPAPEGPLAGSPANAGPGHPCDDDGGDALTFAAGDLLSFQTRRVSYCGGADPDTWGDLTSWRIGAAQPARVTAEQVLGLQLKKELLKAGSADVKNDRDRFGDPDEKMWGLLHEQGVWVLEGGRPRTTGSNGPSFGDYTFAASLPRKLVGTNVLRKPWAEYQKLDANAGDVVDSPSGRLVVLFDRDAIRLFVDGREKEKLDFEDAQVVMTQWAIGSQNVSHWVKDATAALAH